MKTQNMIEMLETATPVLEALSTLFVFLIGLLALFIIIRWKRTIGKNHCAYRT
jgi:high-affinity nickel permease